MRAATCAETGKACVAFDAGELADLPMRPASDAELWAGLEDQGGVLWLVERVAFGTFEVAAALAAFQASERAEQHAALLQRRRGWSIRFALTTDLRPPRRKRLSMSDEERRAKRRAQDRARRERVWAEKAAGKATMT